VITTDDPFAREAFVIGLSIGVGIGYWLGGVAWWLIVRMPARVRRRRRDWRGRWS
jgi:hypothetical protein